MKISNRLEKEFPVYFIQHLCKNLRKRHRTYDRNLGKVVKRKPITWKICIAYNVQKLIRLHSKVNPKKKEDTRVDSAYAIYQKEKLLKRYDENYAWRLVENRILNKVNNHKFPKEVGSLWSWFIQVQNRKLNRRKTKKLVRGPKYRFPHRQVEKIKYLHTMEKPKDEDWKFWWLAQHRKLLNRYRAVAGNKFGFYTFNQKFGSKE